MWTISRIVPELLQRRTGDQKWLMRWSLPALQIAYTANSFGNTGRTIQKGWVLSSQNPSGCRLPLLRDRYGAKEENSNTWAPGAR